MFDGIVGTGLAEAGPVGLLSLFVLLIFFGGLVPRWLHTQRMADKDERIRYLESMVDKRDEQFVKLIEQGELVVRLLEGLRSEAARRP